MTDSCQIRYSISLSWVNCCEIGNANDVISRKLNNAFIGLPDSGTEYCIRRVPDCHSKNPGFSSWEGKPNSCFLVFGHCIGEWLLWRWYIGRSLKLLDNVTRDVFVRTKFLAVLWKIKELICVILCVLGQLMGKASKAIWNEKNI